MAILRSARLRDMRFLHLAAADHGGAGTAAVRLHQALERAGATSRMIVWSRRGTIPGVVALEPRSAIAKARRFLARAWARLTTRRAYHFQDQRLSLAGRTDLVAQAVHFRPDLIVVHSISAFLSFADVRTLQLRTGARIAWSPPDMGLLTGGCHYAWRCEAYRHGCGGCPALPLRPRDDASAATVRDKAAALKAMDHVLVAASSTLRRQAEQSVLFGGVPIRTVHIGIDEEEFPWIERGQARSRLGISHKGRVLFFGAQRLSDRRKGIGLLLDALARLGCGTGGKDRPLLLVAGEANGLAGLDGTGFEVHRLGYVDREALALAYAAADLFVCPSIEDSGPMMVNESLMAGTPVVAFAIGVVPDLVIPRTTGIVAAEISAAGLATALVEALDWIESRSDEIRTACRDLAREKCSLDMQARAFIEIASQPG